jgi:hypothetical protein
METSYVSLIFADTSAFKAMSCAKGGKTRNQTKLYFSLINRKLARQHFLFNQHIHFPFGKLKKVSLFMENMLK